MTTFYYDADTGAGAAAQFCPNCGTKVTVDDRFCPNCGFDLTPQPAETPTAGAAQPTTQAATQPVAPTPQPAAPHQTPSRSAAPAKPMSKGTKIKLGVGLGVAVVLIGGYLGLKSYYAPERQVTRLVKVITSGSTDQFAANMATNDSVLKLNTRTVKPFVTYLRADKERLANFTRSIQGHSSTRYGVRLGVRGKHWLLFPKYVLTADAPTYVTLSSRRTGVKLTQDGKTLLTTAAGKKSVKAGPLLPGAYTFAASGEVAGKKATAKLKTTVDSNGSQEPVAFDFTTVKLAIDSDLEGGTVTDTNGDKLGTIKDGAANIGPVLYVKGMKFFVTKTFKSGDVTSSKYNPANDYDVSRNIDGDASLNSKKTLSEDTADNLVYNVLSGVQALSSDSDSDLSDYFQDTANNAYKFFHDVGDRYAKRDDVSYSGFGGNVRKVSRTDVNTWQVSFDMTYTVDYTDYEKDERVQTFTGNLNVVSDGEDDYGDTVYKVASMATTTSNGETVPAMYKVYDNNANTSNDSPTGDSDRVY
ncbi:zinc ribbon domain-containing protein [Lacticaseibacillus kribbianus]|uniref:zinc ribbon domain-containing protein n=1 Tax=Lacticaseibacillus kribbianus TaxID=2926292 RepID=UPI001CD2A791|nr:zinc-ribbon domain-containing protein [Lacticaseibacillus kribbianus]